MNSQTQVTTPAKTESTHTSMRRLQPSLQLTRDTQGRSDQVLPAESTGWPNYSLSKIGVHYGSPRPSIQAKLQVGPVNDQYEQEADHIATQVVNQANPSAMQRQDLSTEDEEKLQTKPLLNSVQRQSTPDEEDKVQTKPLAATITPLVQRETKPEDEKEKLQTKPLAQRAMQPEKEEEKLQASPALQRAKSDGSFEVGHDFETQMKSTGGGSPLPTGTREFMEPRFGADFSAVRLHTGKEAAQLNRMVNAQAFTHGQNIYLGEGKTNLESSEGKHLLAHELTHTIQQGASPVQRQPQKSGSNTRGAEGLPMFAGATPDSQVVGHLQALRNSTNHNAQLYRKEIRQFQAENPTEKIAAAQQQVLGSSKAAGIQQKDNSQTLRRCGGGGGSSSAPPAPATPLTFSSASFSAGTGGSLTTPSTGGTLRIESSAYSPSGSVNVSGGTNAEAQDWEAGFIQTAKSFKNESHYIGSKKEKLQTYSIPGARRDALVAGGEPWYDPNNVNGNGRKAFTNTNSKVSVELWDQPGVRVPWNTPDTKGKLDHNEGKAVFTAWMIARKKTNPNTIHYINWTSWEVDFGVTFNYASSGTKSVKSITGKTKNMGSGAGQGADTPILSGTTGNNSVIGPVWS